MIKKFKNGNINIKRSLNNCQTIDDFYNNELTMCDLYFNQINGYMYLIDFNTNKIYDFSNCYINILKYLETLLESGKILKLYPLSNKESKQLFIDLENGF